MLPVWYQTPDAAGEHGGTFISSRGKIFLHGLVDGKLKEGEYLADIP